MAARNSWAVNNVLGTEDVRLHIGALITPGATNVKARTGLRPGGSTATVSPGLVAAVTPTANKTVTVQPFQMFMQTGRGAGTYIQCLDSVATLDLLTAHPADGSLQRNDLIIAQQNDVGYSDADSTWTVKQVVGSPSGAPQDPNVTGSTDYVTLARVRVTANANTITSSMIDDLRPPWAVGLGGILPIKSVTDRGTLTPYDGMAIWRIDRQWIEVYSIAANGWLVQGIGVCSSTSDAATAITTPYTGQRITISSVHYYWTGTAWQVTPGTTIGGQVRVNDTAGAIGATETVVVTSPTFNLDASSLYLVTFHATGDNSSAVATDYDLRIRADTLTGTQLRQKVMPRPADAYPVGDTIHLIYGTTATESRAFVGTLARVTGTATFTPRPGCYIEVRKLGTSSILGAL